MIWQVITPAELRMQHAPVVGAGWARAVVTTPASMAIGTAAHRHIVRTLDRFNLMIWTP
jgi:hypothetical protein